MISLLYSCKKETHEIIDGGNYKFWFINRGTYLYPELYYFDNTGHVTSFVKTNSLGGDKYMEYDGEDNILSNEWDIYGDSIFYLYNHNYQILDINNSTLIIKFVSNTEEPQIRR